MASVLDTARDETARRWTQVTVVNVEGFVCLKLSRGGSLIALDESATGALSPAKARELAAVLLVAAARIDGDLDDAIVGVWDPFDPPARRAVEATAAMLGDPDGAEPTGVGYTTHFDAETRCDPTTMPLGSLRDWIGY